LRISRINIPRSATLFEIRALEALDAAVIRYALQTSPQSLVDVEDEAEQTKTHYILAAGLGEFVRCCFTTLMRPVALIETIRLTLRIGWRSDRGLLRHFAYLIEAIVLAQWCRRDRAYRRRVYASAEAICKAGLERQITVTGWLSGERVKAEMAAARALILPSFAENLPVVIMEAMASARPVISTYIAGIPELVIPGQTGWLVPASDDVALAGAMREALAESVEKLTDMGLMGRARVIESHDVRKEAAALKMLFEYRNDGFVLLGLVLTRILPLAAITRWRQFRISKNH
jgi:hypothetical protein